MSSRALLRRYVAALSLLGIGLVAFLVALGLVQGLWVPLLILLGVVSAQLGRSVGAVALWAPLIVGVIWTIVLIIAVTLGYDTGTDTGDSSAGWAAVFGLLGIVSMLIAAELGVLVGLIARRKAHAQSSPS